MVTTITHRLIDNWLTQDVITSVQQVCLAGVGACMIAGTASRKWFGALVQRGEEGKAQASHQAEEIIGRFQERFETIQTDTLKNLKKLEKTFQKPIRRRLCRLGILSRKDVQHLARRVEMLQQSIQDRKPMAEIGHKEGEKVSQNHEYMAEIGHIDGKEVRAHGLEIAEVRAHGLEIAEVRAHGLETAEVRAHGLETAKVRAHGLETAEARAHGLETAEVRAHGLDTAEVGRKGHENPRSERKGQSRTKNHNRKQANPALP